jgi:hypothetical protein
MVQREDVPRTSTTQAQFLNIYCRRLLIAHLSSVRVTSTPIVPEMIPAPCVVAHVPVLSLLQHMYSAM